MTVIREFGWVALELDGEERKALERLSTELRKELKLPEAPFVQEGDRIKARHIAGFLRLGDRTIEIAPKYLGSDSNDRWRDAFFNILARTGRLATSSRIEGGNTDSGIPELMGLIIDEALTQAAFHGLPRLYLERRDYMDAVRGRIDVERLWHQLIDPSTISCTFDTFVEDGPIARLLKWAAGELAGDVRTEDLAFRLSQHVEALATVTDETPDPFSLATIRLHPSHAFLADAVEIALVLASGSALTLTPPDGVPARAFLWKTATIFEEFVFAVCADAAQDCGGRAEKRGYPLGEHLRGVRGKSRGPLRTIPDIVVSLPHWRTVLDAKYKTLGDSPESADVYQVMAGGRLLGAAVTSLVYPAQERLVAAETWELGGTGRPIFLHALPVDLSRMAEADGFESLVRSLRDSLLAMKSSEGRHASRQLAAVG